MMFHVNTIAVTYHRALIQALALQVVLLILGAMVLDGGECLSAVVYSSIAYWAGLAFVVFRRPSTPTGGDLVFVRYGLIPIVIGGVLLFIYVWGKKGAI